VLGRLAGHYPMNPENIQHSTFNPKSGVRAKNLGNVI
jgi:hypothetical protein